MRAKSLITLSLLFLSSSLFAQEEPRWALIPALAYNSETGVQGGALAKYFLQTASGEQTGDIGLGAFYSQKGQFRLAFRPYWVTSKELWRFRGKFDLYHWPANFYAVGNNSPDSAAVYLSEELSARIELDRLVLPEVYLGLLLAAKQEEVSWKEGAPEIFSQSGSPLLGAGLRVSRDSRDNVYEARRGSLQRYSAMGNTVRGGSYFQQELDIRAYQKFFKNLVLATAFSLESTLGDVPFRQLAGPDGVKRLRGLEKGRYLDRHSLVLQSELRFPLFWRFSMTVFSELAQVAPRLEKLSMKRWHSAVGAGGRLVLNRKQRFSLRADLSLVDAEPALVIYVKEAF